VPDHDMPGTEVSVTPPAKLEPWQIHGERTLHDNRWVTLTLVDVEPPGVERFEHHVVRLHHVAIAAVVDEHDRVLMLWRYRFVLPLPRHMWDTSSSSQELYPPVDVTLPWLRPDREPVTKRLLFSLAGAGQSVGPTSTLGCGNPRSWARVSSRSH
jgi:hypothetical protein